MRNTQTKSLTPIINESTCSQDILFDTPVEVNISSGAIKDLSSVFIDDTNYIAIWNVISINQIQLFAQFFSNNIPIGESVQVISDPWLGYSAISLLDSGYVAIAYSNRQNSLSNWQVTVKTFSYSYDTGLTDTNNSIQINSSNHNQGKFSLATQSDVFLVSTAINKTHIQTSKYSQSNSSPIYSISTKTCSKLTEMSVTILSETNSFVLGWSGLNKQGIFLQNFDFNSGDAIGNQANIPSFPSKWLTYSVNDTFAIAWQEQACAQFNYSYYGQFFLGSNSSFFNFTNAILISDQTPNVLKQVNMINEYVFSATFLIDDILAVKILSIDGQEINDKSDSLTLSESSSARKFSQENVAFYPSMRSLIMLANKAVAIIWRSPSNPIENIFGQIFQTAAILLNVKNLDNAKTVASNLGLLILSYPFIRDNVYSDLESTLNNIRSMTSFEDVKVLFPIIQQNTKLLTLSASVPFACTKSCDSYFKFIKKDIRIANQEITTHNILYASPFVSSKFTLIYTQINANNLALQYGVIDPSQPGTFNSLMNNQYSALSTIDSNVLTSTSAFSIEKDQYILNLFKQRQSLNPSDSPIVQYSEVFAMDSYAEHNIIARMQNVSSLSMETRSNTGDIIIPTLQKYVCMGESQVIKIKTQPSSNFFALVYGSPNNAIANIECYNIVSNAFVKNGNSQSISQSFSNIKLDVGTKVFAVAYQNTYGLNQQDVGAASVNIYSTTDCSFKSTYALNYQVAQGSILESIKVLDCAMLAVSFIQSNNIITQIYQNGGIWRPDLNPNGAISTQLATNPSDLVMDYNTDFVSSEEPDCYKSKLYTSYIAGADIYTSEFEVQIHGAGNNGC
jgi:hypothetical protein